MTDTNLLLDSGLEPRLNHLALQPPQVLLIEGGSEKSRMQTALYWVKNLDCPSALAKLSQEEPGIPCRNCHTCRLIDNLEYTDLCIYDGRISNRQDEENPGLIRALRLDNMRQLKSRVVEAPKGNGKRAAIFLGLTQAREEAMNSLLKTLEEPSPFTVFVLLAPQRAQLLPTLVSRSFCLTLPWPSAINHYPAHSEWLEDLAEFVTNGSRFLEKTAAKNALDSVIASEILSGLQAALARCVARKPQSHSIDKLLLPLAESPKAAFEFSSWINEAQKMLDAAVSPARVLEALASKTYCLMRNSHP